MSLSNSPFKNLSETIFFYITIFAINPSIPSMLIIYLQTQHSWNLRRIRKPDILTRHVNHIYTRNTLLVIILTSSPFASLTRSLMCNFVALRDCTALDVCSLKSVVFFRFSWRSLFRWSSDVLSQVFFASNSRPSFVFKNKKNNEHLSGTQSSILVRAG